MKRAKRLTTWTLAALVITSALSGGCYIDNPLRIFGPNMTINLILPLGLNGNPGLLNPFGLVQALVNSLAGITASAGTGGTGGTGGGGSGGSPSGVPAIL